jgi:anti-sigma factor RsiW
MRIVRRHIVRNKEHPSFATLTDLVDQRMTPAEMEQIRHHIETCATCAAEARVIAELVDVMRTDISVAAPPDVVARAKRTLRVHEVQPTSPPSVIRRIVAALSFDSAGTQPLMGVRATRAEGRQLLYHAEPFDIDLRLERTDRSWTLAGQVLGPCEGGEIEVYDANQRVVAELNPFCEFSLSPLTSGTWTLVLHLAQAHIEVSPIELGPTHGPG